MAYKTFFMDTVPSCTSDECASGRVKCQTPEACRLPEHELPVVKDEWEPATTGETVSLLFWPGVVVLGLVCGLLLALFRGGA